MKQEFQEKLLQQSLAVRTKVLPEVAQLVEQVKLPIDDLRDYKTEIKKWLSPILDLSSFSVYPMGGITEGLNWWMGKESREIQMLPGDYQWVRPRVGKGTIWYQSCPSAIDGNLAKLKQEETLALDLAYVGSCKPFKLSTTNVDYVFFSLSKSFGLRNFRVGWMFTKRPDEDLDKLIYQAKYYHYHSAMIGEAILAAFDIDYVFNKLRGPQLNLCDQLDISPSDSVWLANSTDPIYEKFRRSSDIARISLSPLIFEFMENS